MHGVAAEHERNNVPVNLASHLVDVNIFRSTSSITVLVEELPRSIDISRAFFGRECNLRFLLGRSTRLRHLEQRSQWRDAMGKKKGMGEERRRKQRANKILRTAIRKEKRMFADG